MIAADTNLDALRGRVVWLKHQLKLLPAYQHPDDASMDERDARRKSYFDAVARLNHDLLALPDQPAGIRHSNNQTALSMMGIKVSCTAGLVGACRNWVSRAEQVLA